MAFRKPAVNKVGGKFFVLGLPACGKSYFGLTFPNSACIDSETGLAFYENEDVEINGKKYNNIKLIDTTANLDDLEQNLDSIIEGELDGIETLVIDSETKFYNSMDIGATEVEERKAKAKNKEVDTRAKWGRVKSINVKFQQAKISASAKGMHVVSVAQAKEVTSEDGKRVIGYAPETHKSLPFDYDVVLRFYKEKNAKTGEIEYFAEVEKDRTGVTKDGQKIKNCTFDIWKDYFDKRNGLKTTGANFSKDLTDSVNSVLCDSELQEELATEIVSKMKVMDKSKAPELRELMKTLEVELKDLKFAPIKSLRAINSFFEGV